jgi:glycosyltransferase involved in cell wall biosynthesis
LDGKQFACGDERFLFRGVTYGTFQPRDDGARFPEREQVKRDFAAMNEAGFTVVRTYTLPPDDLVELAADWGLRLLCDAFYLDWRYLVGESRRDCRRMARQARDEVRAAARKLVGNHQILGISLGNEVPADVVRWVGTKAVSGVIAELADVVREEDPEQLVTYANYPTAEYLPLPDLDFLTFNVFLEDQSDFRRYLTRLQILAGDRPLVLGEVGLHAGAGAGGEPRQAEVIDWQLATALERGVAGTCVYAWTDEWWVGDGPVEGWKFGLTRADRSARPALGAATRWNSRTVADLHDRQWPSISVVICAYNAETTLDECLRHTCALAYPHLEVIVIDDGSTDATAAIAGRYPAARLVTIDHAGLSTARNAGLEAASGQLVAYLDSDAYPTPEWPYYLALGMDSPTVGGVGGPNIPPTDAPLGAQQVARAPGGPVHVLFTDDRAEHLPGCNMAFWKQTLDEVGGFDPVYTAAGDDVDVCWKVLDRNWELGFHPAAVVWHHRRPGVRTYLKQQQGYGRAEALVEARHPNRFSPLGTARWGGRIYNSLLPPPGRQRIYRGAYGSAHYQSVYRGGGHALDIVHQVGVPMASLGLLVTAITPFWRPLIILPVLALCFLFLLACVDTRRVIPPRSLRRGRIRFRLSVVLLNMLQPLVRRWARLRATGSARKGLPPTSPLPGPARRARGGVLILPDDRPRADLATAVICTLQRTGLKALSPTGWEAYDARFTGSALVYGDLVTSSHPIGAVQVRMKRRLRGLRLAGAAAATAVVAFVSATLGLVMAAAFLANIMMGWWRTGPFVRRTLRRAAR